MKGKKKRVSFSKITVKIFFFLFAAVLNIIAFYLIYNAFIPVAKWYWEAMPLRGVDLINASTYVSYLKRHFAMLPLAWKYIWFAGQPLITDYPSLHFYLAQFFSDKYTAVQSIQLWMLVSSFLNFCFSYLLYAKLAKSRALATILSILTVYSVNVYGALIWGGSIPYYGTQMFLPLTLYFLVNYVQTGKRRWFSGAVLSLGISQYGHPQVALSYGLALSGLTLLFAQRSFNSSVGKRFLDVLLFGVLIFLIGLPITYAHLNSLRRIPQMIQAGITGATPVSYQATPGPEVSDEIREFYQTRIYQFYSDTHPWLSWLAGVSVLLFLVVYFSTTFLRVITKKTRESKSVFKVLWATLLLGYIALYLYLYSIGIDIFHGGWYRTFWSTPLVIGMLAAVCWGEILSLLTVKRETNFTKFIAYVMDAVMLGVVFLVSSFFYLNNFEESLYAKSTTAASYPGKVVAAVNKEQQDELVKDVVPDWISVNDHDYRLYNADQTYNMWFNAFFDLPLARGYIDVPVSHWSVFLTDILLDRDVAVEEFEYPVEVAKNATKFVIDWNAIRYLAGENLGAASSVTTKFSSYINSDEFIKRQEVWSTYGSHIARPSEAGGVVYSKDLKNDIKYLELKEDLAGPIMSFNNAPAVLFVGDKDYWEIFIRTLAQMGMTSKDIIPVRGPKFVNEVGASDLLSFDAIFMYGYDYKNRDKVWGLIDTYVKNGGILLVDTGAEVKESSSVELPPPYPEELPGVFPVLKTRRDRLGESWQVEKNNNLSDINFSLFSPLVYDGDEWKVSYAEPSDIDGQATELLALKGKSVLVNWHYGSGKVLWSGLNLPAHIERYKNLEEGKLFRKLIDGLLQDIKAETGGVDKGNVEFISAEKRRISGYGARGVLFKESVFPGWKANVSDGNSSEKLKIWPAGLGEPGMMWVRIPEIYRDKTIDVEFIFRGSSATWIRFLIAGLISVVLFDSFAFNAKIFGASLRKIWNLINKKFGKWWEHEEE